MPTSFPIPFLGIAESLRPSVMLLRRAFHANPELRWEETRTLEAIARAIDDIRGQIPEWAYLHSPVSARGGLWVDLLFRDVEGPSRIFRADIDALPIQEATGLPYASTVTGKMHACGHDCHAAMLLGALRALATGCMRQEALRCSHIRFVFQRAEENPSAEPRPESGGFVLVQERVLEGFDDAYALHVDPRHPVGTLLSRPGPMLGNSDRLFVTVRCTGGHVAEPHKGSNAIEIAEDIGFALRNFAVRTLGPRKPVSLAPAEFRSGTASNVRPSEAYRSFAVRTFLGPEERAAFHQAISTEVDGVIGRYPDATADIRIGLGHPAMSCSPDSVAKAESVVQSLGMTYKEAEPQMGGEDFAHYLQKVPGAMVMLGAANEGSGSFHTPTFNPSEDALLVGVAFWLALACTE